MHRVRKFLEVGSGRIGYAMTEAALSERLSAFNNSVIDASPKRSELIDEKYERLNRIIAFYTNGAPLFLEYLRLDIKMRYFWPFPAKKIIHDPQQTEVKPDGLRQRLRRWRKQALKKRAS